MFVSGVPGRSVLVIGRHFALDELGCPIATRNLPRHLTAALRTQPSFIDTENMAIEQLFEALPLHYLQHGISKFGAGNVALAVLVTGFLGVMADYVWMLYMRSKMVRRVCYFDGNDADSS